MIDPKQENLLYMEDREVFDDTLTHNVKPDQGRKLDELNKILETLYERYTQFGVGSLEFLALGDALEFLEMLAKDAHLKQFIDYRLSNDPNLSRTPALETEIQMAHTQWVGNASTNHWKHVKQFPDYDRIYYDIVVNDINRVRKAYITNNNPESDFFWREELIMLQGLRNMYSSILIHAS